MGFECPRCGSRFLRESKPRNAAERSGRWRFVSPLRCVDCQTRFVASTLNVADLRYARCPGCYRMDLNRWTGKNFEPPFWTGLKASFGANRWRCEYCRLNFSSFRARKEIFTFSRWAKINAALAGEGEARTEETRNPGEAAQDL